MILFMLLLRVKKSPLKQNRRISQNQQHRSIYHQCDCLCVHYLQALVQNLGPLGHIELLNIPRTQFIINIIFTENVQAKPNFEYIYM